MEGERLHVAIIEQVNLRELGSTTLGGLFFTGSGSEADFLDAGRTTATVNAPECLAQILRGECGRDDTQSGTLTARVVKAYTYATRLNVRNDDRNLVALEAVDDVLPFLCGLPAVDDVGAIEFLGQLTNGVGEVHQQDHAHALLDTIAGHFDYSRDFVELHRLAGAEDDCHLAGSAGFHAFGKTSQSCLILLLLGFLEFLAHGVVHALDVFSLAGVDDGRFDDGFREVRDVGDSESATTRGENLLVQSLEVILSPGELHAERSLADTITHSPCPEISDGVQPEGKADGTHLQRIAGRSCGAEQNAEVLSASGDEQFCVQAGTSLALLALIEDDERILRDVPDVAVTAAAALRQLADAYLFVIAHEDRLDAEPGGHQLPVGSGSFGGKLTENLTSAVARDVLADILLRLDAAGYRVVMHIHDEVVVEVPTAGVDTALKDVHRIMTTTPDWLEGLPLSAETITSPFYTK